MNTSVAYPCVHVWLIVINAVGCDSSEILYTCIPCMSSTASTGSCVMARDVPYMYVCTRTYKHQVTTCMLHTYLHITKFSGIPSNFILVSAGALQLEQLVLKPSTSSLDTTSPVFPPPPPLPPAPSLPPVLSALHTASSHKKRNAQTGSNKLPTPKHTRKTFPPTLFIKPSQATVATCTFRHTRHSSAVSFLGGGQMWEHLHLLQTPFPLMDNFTKLHVLQIP